MSLNSLTRRSFALGGLACLLPSLARADNGRTVQFIIPFAPGTTPDVLARLLGSTLAKTDGQAYVTDNRVGASGMIGLSAVARAPADGRTLTVNTNTALTLPFFYRKVPFDVLDGFTPVAMLGIVDFALCVNSATGFRSLADFLAAARQAPGRLTYGSPGMGTFHHLCMELLMNQGGIRLSHVPYKGAANATTDLLGGHVDAMFLPVHVAAQHARDGKIFILGGTRRQQDKARPEVRPLAESGLPGYEADSWYAVWGPPGMAAEQVGRLNAEINRLLSQDAEVRSSLAKQGILAQPMSPAQLHELARKEYAKWQTVIAQTGIKPE